MHNLEKTKAVSWLNKQVQALKIKLKVDEITSSDEKSPQEEPVLQLFAAVEDEVQYPTVMAEIKTLLTANNEWRVAVKTLAVIHRLVAERRRPSFTDLESHNSYHINGLKTMCLFNDESSPLARECTIWVRAYSYYLLRRLLCNRIFKCDIVAELNQNTQKIEDLGIEKLLKYLPFLQRLLRCLLDCAPKGSQVASNSLIQYALRLLVKDCPNIYGAINACMGKLLDSFFSMPRHTAIRVVYIYKQRIQQFKQISYFNNACRDVLSSASNDFRSLSAPSESLLAEMEDYIKIGNGEISEEKYQRPLKRIMKKFLPFSFK